MTAITRSTDHRYTYEGKTYPGVTGILKVIDKSDALMAWAARQTAEAAIGLAVEMKDEPGSFSALDALIDTVGAEGAIKAVTSRSSWKRDEAANIGSQIHDIADRIVKGEGAMSVPPPIWERAQLYADWWKASGWTLRLSEAFVVNPAVGYGGTFDLLARDRDGRTVLADVKTGKGVYREAVLQLTAYALAPLVARPGDAKAYAMPKVDRFVILHVTAKGVREIEVPVGTLEMAAFLACVDLSRWSETTKGKRL